VPWTDLKVEQEGERGTTLSRSSAFPGRPCPPVPGHKESPTGPSGEAQGPSDAWRGYGIPSLGAGPHSPSSAAL